MIVVVFLKKLLVYVLIAMVFLLSLDGLDIQGQQEHQIIGRYLSGVDLIYPYGIQVTDSKIFLLDQNWVKKFDKRTHQYLSQFSITDASFEAPSPDWKNLLISNLISDHYLKTYSSGFTNPMRDRFKVQYWHSLFLDENENCIILGDGIIYRFDSESGKLIKAIDLKTILITLTPLRFVSESLEAEVSWEASTQKVTITYPRSGKKESE